MNRVTGGGVGRCMGAHVVLVVSAPQIRFLERSLLWEKSRIFIP